VADDVVMVSHNWLKLEWVYSKR